MLFLLLFSLYCCILIALVEFNELYFIGRERILSWNALVEFSANNHQTCPKTLTLYLASAKTKGAASIHVGNKKTEPELLSTGYYDPSPSHIPCKQDSKPQYLKTSAPKPWVKRRGQQLLSHLTQPGGYHTPILVTW